MTKLFRFFLMVLLGILFSASVSAEPATSDSFDVPSGLKNEVRFWRTIFGTYGDNQIVFYDERHLHIVYEVMDFSSLRGRQRQTAINQTIQKIAGSLEHLATGFQDESLTDQEKYYQKLFGSSDPEVYRAAIKRIRVQPGQKHHLARAIAKADPWMADIEAIFEKKGLPKELTALMFIESMFNPRARSEVGASGLWQFMPDTGQNYLTMNDFWDDRNDTLKASEGAADFLADLYRQTGSWPLAVNAYHSGLGRIAKAIQILGTKDIAKVVHGFNDAGYGFYSRNYVPEFLAVVSLYRNRAQYFAPVEADKRQYDIVRTSDFVILPELATRSGIEMADLIKLNTALKPDVLNGDLPLPPYYLLKVPKGRGYTVAKTAGLLK